MNADIPFRQTTDRIVVHMAETNPAEPTPIAAIRKFHTDPPPAGRGWKDVAYNRYIRRDGTVEQGRDDDQVGGHTVGWNSVSVAVCLEGGLGARRGDAFEQHFTPEQGVSLLAVIREWQEKYGPGLAVYGHDNAPSCAPEKQCPGFDAGAWWAVHQADM